MRWDIHQVDDVKHLIVLWEICAKQNRWLKTIVTSRMVIGEWICMWSLQKYGKTMQTAEQLLEKVETMKRFCCLGEIEWLQWMWKLQAGMAIASLSKSHRTFFPKKIASTYRIETHKKIASVIASQNWIKIICDYCDYFDFL